ncbi:hypothetical protein C2845_PM13G02190 [Panicum miliaceum]|uniref:Uncharacterized protein n=1 Tax=Panicum miliaceum TaxID=4540 RepID=A0A3L6RFA8_PANMI|nr:hypothetical protein C2845_PM13G02190 [Panicum miliaceum]
MERSPVATPPEIEEGHSSGSPSVRTPKGGGPITKSTSRQLRSVYWKEFEPIIQNGEILYAKSPSPEKLLVQVVAPPVYKSSTIANPASDDTTDLIEDDFGADAYFV